MKWVTATQAWEARSKRKPRELVPIALQALARVHGGGFGRGLHVLAAVPFAGKTTLAIQIGVNAAKKGHPMGYAALELDAEEAADHGLSILAKVPLEKVRLGGAELLSPQVAEEWQSLPWGCWEFATAPQPSEVVGLVSKLRAAYPDAPIPLLIVDYLQLISKEGGQAAERSTYGEVCAALRRAAKKENVAVLLISSVARHGYESMAKKTKSPAALMGAGKESGSIEYSADSVTVLTAPKGKRECVTCVVPKCRETGTDGECELQFDGVTFNAAAEEPRPYADVAATAAEIVGSNWE